MKLFMVAALGAVLMAGCAPFEHGHYSEDVAYRNTAGDPPGTPLVYLGDTQSTPSYSTTSYASADTGGSWKKNWKQGNGRYGSGHHSYGGGATHSAPVTTAYTQPVSYPGTSYAEPVSYAQQATYQQPVTYTQTASYAPPVQQSYVQQAYAQPVRQSFVQPAAQSSYTAATSYGGPQIDSDGYAICDIPYPSHAAHQTPHYKPRF